MTDVRTQAVGESLEHVFRRHQDSPWTFVRGLGNWGDDLLFAGAEALATRLGLAWTNVPLDAFAETDLPAGACIYVQGSGGFNPWCSGSAMTNLKHACAKPVRLVVQGPMSVGGDDDWVAGIMADTVAATRAQELIVFTREQYSYAAIANLAALTAVADVRLDQDSALYLTRDEILALADWPSVPDGDYDLVVMREDPEQGRSDGDARFRGVQLDPAYAANSFQHWIRMHLGARSIVTNRLHSSIIGTLAGKPVTVGPGSYHKNRSVWEQSLVHRGVGWTDSIAMANRQWWLSLPERVRASYKARLMRLALNRIPVR